MQSQNSSPRAFVTDTHRASLRGCILLKNVCRFLHLLLLLLLPVVLCVLCVWCVCEHVCGVCGVCVRVVDDRVRVCASEVLGYLKQEELLSKKKIFPRGKNFFPKRRTSFHV